MYMHNLNYSNVVNAPPKCFDIVILTKRQTINAKLHTRRRHQVINDKIWNRDWLLESSFKERLLDPV